MIQGDGACRELENENAALRRVCRDVLRLFEQRVSLYWNTPENKRVYAELRRVLGGVVRDVRLGRDVRALRR